MTDFLWKALGVLLACGLWGVTALAQVITSGKPDESMICVLIIDGQNHHNWHETTPVLKEILEETGLFLVDVATSPEPGEDMSKFRPNFSDYDVVVSNYVGDSWCDGMKRDFERFVANGGGFVVYHSASSAFPDWPEYNKMCGLGGWGNRSENSGASIYRKDGTLWRDPNPGPAGTLGAPREFLLINLAPKHPIMKDMPAKFLHASDELYERLRGPAEGIGVLATAFSDPEMGGTGREEPQLMAILYGKGRVFHITYGHAGKQCHSVAFLLPFLRGTQWAATGVVTIPIPEDVPTEEKSYVRP